MFDKLPRNFQYFDCVMRFFPGIYGILSDLARDRLARYANFLGICGTFKDLTECFPGTYGIFKDGAFKDFSQEFCACWAQSASNS